MVPLFGAAYAAPNKGTTILYCFMSPKTVLNPPVNGTIKELFKAFLCFSRTFQGKYNFQGLFKIVLYIQVLFKPVQTLYNGTKIFQYCTCPAGPVTYNFHSSYKPMNLSFKSVCNKEHKVVICNMTSWSYSFKGTCLVGRVLWEESLIFSRFHS